MNRKNTKTVTPKNFNDYEKRIWRMEYRFAKALAGGLVGRIVGDILFVSVLLGATYCWILVPDNIVASDATSLVVFLGSLWKDICNAFLPVLGALEGGSFFAASVLVAILVALVGNLVINVVVQLVRPKVKFIPLDGNGATQAAALYRRCLAVADLPSRKWYFNIISGVVYGIMIAVEGMQEDLAELGTLSTGYVLLSLFAMLLVIFLFMIPYLLYRGLSGLIIFVLYSTSRKFHQYDSMKCALREYADQCKKQEEEKAKAEQARIKAEKAERDRLRGKELCRQAIDGNKVNENLLVQAAELGYQPACLFMGRRLMDKWDTGTYTRKEKLELAEAAKRYFYTVFLGTDIPEQRIEGEFGYQLFTVIIMDETGASEKASPSEWLEIQSSLRNVRLSRMLAKKYEDRYIWLMDYVEYMLDEAEKKRNTVVLDSDMCNRIRSRADSIMRGSSYDDDVRKRAEWERLNRDFLPSK